MQRKRPTNTCPVTTGLASPITVVTYRAEVIGNPVSTLALRIANLKLYGKDAATNSGYTW